MRYDLVAAGFSLRNEFFNSLVWPVGDAGQKSAENGGSSP
jgi:hypothetical protein